MCAGGFFCLDDRFLVLRMRAFFFHLFFCAFWADAMAEIGLGMMSNKGFELAPVPVIVTSRRGAEKSNCSRILGEICVKIVWHRPVAAVRDVFSHRSSYAGP